MTDEQSLRRALTRLYILQCDRRYAVLCFKSGETWVARVSDTTAPHMGEVVCGAPIMYYTAKRKFDAILECLLSRSTKLLMIKAGLLK